MAALAAAAYLETALEDNVIGERMQAGRFALLSREASESVRIAIPWKAAWSTSINTFAEKWVMYSNRDYVIVS